MCANKASQVLRRNRMLLQELADQKPSVQSYVWSNTQAGHVNRIPEERTRERPRSADGRTGAKDPWRKRGFDSGEGGKLTRLAGPGESYSVMQRPAGVDHRGFFWCSVLRALESAAFCMKGFQRATLGKYSQSHVCPGHCWWTETWGPMMTEVPESPCYWEFWGL